MVIYKTAGYNVTTVSAPHFFHRLYPTDPFVSRFIEDGASLMGYQIPPNVCILLCVLKA